VEATSFVESQGRVYFCQPGPETILRQRIDILLNSYFTSYSAPSDGVYLPDQLGVPVVPQLSNQIWNTNKLA
jgi:hypothetical protein